MKEVVLLARTEKGEQARNYVVILIMKEVVLLDKLVALWVHCQLGRNPYYEGSSTTGKGAVLLNALEGAS